MELDIEKRLRGTLTDKDNYPRMGSETWLPVSMAMEAADEIARLRTENWQLKQACGYPIPADKETINNPFKCGMCDARERSTKEPE